MKILIDISPIRSKSKKRGIGFYTKHLVASLRKYDKANTYQLFIGKEKIPPKTDLVHYPYFDFFYLTLPLVKKTKTIVTVHDATPLVFPKKFPKGIKGLIKYKIQKTSLKRTDAVITDSHCSKRDIVKFLDYPKEKIFVIPLAPSENFKRIKDQSQLEAVRKKYKLPKKFILYVGDANWNKNLLNLTKACRKLKIPLVLVGQTFILKKFNRSHFENQSLVEVQKQIKKHKNIFAPGFVKAKDLVLLYNLATVYCQPSYYEGFGLPVLEAMRCGCPVVCSQTPSLPEVAGDAAYYFNPYSKNSLCKSLKKCLDDKNLARKLSILGEKQAKKFSLRKTALETSRVYQKVLG